MSGLGEIKAEAAPTRADVEHALSRLDRELGSKMALLGELGLFEVRAFREVGTGILPVGIEKQVVDGAVDIVMVRHVSSGPPRRIELHDATAEIARGTEAANPAGHGVILEIGEKQLEEIVDATLDHLEPAVHVGLAEGQLRVDHELPLDAFILETEGD